MQSMRNGAGSSRSSLYSREEATRSEQSADQASRPAGSWSIDKSLSVAYRGVASGCLEHVPEPITRQMMEVSGQVCAMASNFLISSTYLMMVVLGVDPTLMTS